MVVPPQRDPITGKAVRDVDVLKSAEDVKSKQYKATATQKQKFKLAIIELTDEINRNNRMVSQLIDDGLTEEAIEMLFGLKYKTLDEVMKKILPDSNLSISGGIPTIPVLDPVQLETLMNAIIQSAPVDAISRNTPVAQATAAINDERKDEEKTNNNTQRQVEEFTEIGTSVSLLREFVSAINDINTLFFSQENGQPISTTQLTMNILKSKDVKNLIYAIVNYIALLSKLSPTEFSLAMGKARINPKTGKSYQSEKGFQAMVDLMLGYITRNNDALLKIRELIHAYFQKIVNVKKLPWTIKKEREKMIPGESVKKEEELSIEDRAYAQISDALNLTEVQKKILIDIIIKLREVLNKKNQVMTNEEFFKRVQAIFSSIIEAKDPKDTIETVFDFIFNTAKFIDGIAGLITNREGSIPKMVKYILDELKLQPIKLTDDQPVPTNGYNIDTGKLAPTIGINVNTGEQVAVTSSAEAVSQQDVSSGDDTSTTTLGFELDKQRSGRRQTANLPTTTTRPPYMRFVNVATDVISESLSRGITEASDEVTKIVNDYLAKLQNFLKIRGIKQKNKSDDAVEQKYESDDAYEQKYDRDDVKVAVEMTSTEFGRITQEQVNNAIGLNRLPESRLQALRRRMNEFRQRVGEYRLARVVQVRYTRNGVNTIYGLFESEEKAIEDLYASNLTDNEFESVNYKIKYGLIFPKPQRGAAPPGGGDPYGKNTMSRTGARFSGLSPKDFLYLIIILGLLAGGSIKLSDIFKEPRPDKPAGDGPVPDKPPAPPAKKKDEDGNFIKLDHNSFWDSVGLGGVIDTYNGMVDNYNRMSKEDKKEYGEIVGRFYDKFATIVNVPTLTQLKEARARYDSIRLNYDRAMESGASFEVLNGIYFDLVKSKAFIDEMTNKYLDLENKTFGLNKGKDDADVTIDDVDASISINTSLKGGKSRAVIDDNYALLSKGMTERIKRKLMNKDSNYMSGVIGENKSFINFSLIKDLDYPQGLGTDNPLQFRNKEYEIKQHTNNYSNPQPFKVPSMNKLIKSSKLNKPQLYNVIQIDNKMDDSYGFKYEGLQNPNIPPDKFIKSRLFNPEYVLEKIRENKKPVQTHNDEIRFGPYVGINDNQYFQGGNIQQKQNEELNKYPDTMNKEKDIKKNRKLPNSYSLK